VWKTVPEPLVTAGGNTLLDGTEIYVSLCIGMKWIITPIPPLKELADISLWSLIIRIFEEIDDKVVEGRVREPSILSLPVLGAVQWEDELGWKMLELIILYL
jgi:hypothetical protein